MSKPRIYLGGPIRHSDDNGREWRTEVERDYGHAYELLNPLSWGQPNEDGSAPSGVVQEDLKRLETADVVLVRWRTDIPSRGTSMEIAYANQPRFDIPVVLWCPEADSIEWIDRNVSQWVLAHSDRRAWGDDGRDAAFLAIRDVLGLSWDEGGIAA